MEAHSYEYQVFPCSNDLKRSDFLSIQLYLKDRHFEGDKTLINEVSSW